MVSFKTLTPISLKDCPDINEAMIQEYIYTNPSELQLGDLKGYKREKIQSGAGRVDMIFEDEGSDRWYEVEIQLGSTDPSHIIRTIEYWDNERWKYPQFDHIGVLIAENVTGRFFNVISLFNKHIPIIAIQMSAFKDESGEITLVFSKVLGKEEREVEGRSVDYDRNFWLQKVGEDRMVLTSQIFNDLLDSDEGFRMKYNKYYIGVSKDGIVKNFIEFEPQKSGIVLRLKLPKTEDYDKILSSLNSRYDSQWGRYIFKFTSFDQYATAKETIMPLIAKAKESFGIE